MEETTNETQISRRNTDVVTPQLRKRGIGRLKRDQIIWRVVNGVMAVFFVLAASVQINDPDPYLWVPIYIVPAALDCAIATRIMWAEHWLWRLACMAHVCCCFMFTSFMLIRHMIYDFEMRQYDLMLLHHEEGREVMGLVVIMGWLMLCHHIHRRHFRETNTSPLSTYTTIVVIGMASLPFLLWVILEIGDLGGASPHQTCVTKQF